MSPLIVTETREALIARREAICAALELSAEALAHLSDTRTLTGEELEAQEELEEIAFLLGE